MAEVSLSITELKLDASHELDPWGFAVLEETQEGHVRHRQ